MSEYSREVLAATSLLCGSSGAMKPLQLYRKLLQQCDISEEDFWKIITECPRFLLVRGPAEDGAVRPEDCTVVARTLVRLCGRYGREQCTGAGQQEAGGCQQLHLCKFFIYGNCRFGKGRKLCKFSHDIHSDHNYGLLRDFRLHELHEDDLLKLLLQNDPTLLPEVCSHYNKGSGPHGGCTFQENCTKVHLCQHFVQGDCVFGLKCNRQHAISQHGRRMLEERGCLCSWCVTGVMCQDFFFSQVCSHYNKGSGPHGGCTFQENCTKVHLCQHFVQGDCVFGLKCNRQHAISQHGRRMLEERGLSGDIIEELPFIYRNIHHLTAAAATSTDKQSDNSDDICLHFIRNSCKFHNECRRVHFHLPYKWQVLDGCNWTDLQNMEDVERDYCDPSKIQSCGERPIDFLTMMQESRTVRRLSTVSSVTKPPHYTLTTEWLWYYKGDQGNWVEYGQLDEKQRSTSVSSRTLEAAFQSDRNAEVKVVKGRRQYVISFRDMYQRNPKHNTKRRVCRRPSFVSVAEVEKQDVQ